MTASLSIIADQQILLAREAFSKFGDVRLVEGRSIDQQMIKDADVLLVRSVTQVDESLLKGSKISFVGSATSGIDHIDIEYLKKSSISFSHAPGSNARSVAEYILSSLFETAAYQGFSLEEKTVGIIGCGQVGSRIKHFMDTLGVQCLLDDPPLYEQTLDRAYVELERVLAADIVTLHVPLTIDSKYPTNKLVNKQFLNRLKSDVILINTSRGEVIDETELLAFKESNPKSTLILDVWCNEPEINITLLQQTFIATPHIAGYSYDGKLKATEMLVDVLKSAKNINSSDDRLPRSEQVEDFIEYKDDDVIQLAVMQSYDVRTDAIALGNLKSISGEERASYFDSLRKNYPVRREFTNRIIKTNNITNESRQRLQQLGFKVESA
ncbi:MAG: 4-phosphoerythronate dehydrogenase [Proteobacteria bacterium]|nr:4-phosphoerythronate dehydrogenase [Pseudomonadota bacterium]